MSTHLSAFYGLFVSPHSHAAEPVREGTEVHLSLSGASVVEPSRTGGCIRTQPEKKWPMNRNVGPLSCQCSELRSPTFKTLGNKSLFLINHTVHLHCFIVTTRAN